MNTSNKIRAEHRGRRSVRWSTKWGFGPGEAHPSARLLQDIPGTLALYNELKKYMDKGSHGKEMK